MSRKKSLQTQLAFQTIQNVSVSKMGQAILKKNPYETRVLNDKLEDIEFHKRKWKNDFCWKLNDTRQEFKQTRNMESSSCVRFYCRSKGGKVVRIPDTAQCLSRKPNVGIYQQLGKTSEADATIQKEVTRSGAKKEGAISFVSGNKKTLTTDIKVYVSDKMLRSKENAARDERDGRRGSVTPNCMTPFIRHSFTDYPNRTTTAHDTNWQKCKNCASIVVQEETDSQENNCDAESSYISVPSRQGSKTVHKSSRASTESCFVPTPPPTEKQTHIWRTRTGEIVSKRRVVNGFLKRDKISNLLRGNSELGAEHSLSMSPIKDARFLGLQSSLVPFTNNTRKSQDKVDFRE